MSLVSQITALATAIGVAIKASRDRSNHTGTQSASTIADFSTAVQSAILPTVETVVLQLPRQLQYYEYTLARSATLSTNSVRVWLAPTTDVDDNEISTLEGMCIDAICQAGEIVFYFRSVYLESGNIKLNYQVF